MNDGMPDITVARLLRGLRLATVMITVVTLFGLALPRLLTHASIYRSLLQEIIAFVVLVMVVLVAGAVMWRERRLGRIRWMLLAAVIMASALAVTGVPARFLVSEAEWSYGVVGWLALVVLLDHSALEVLAFLALHTIAGHTYVAVAGSDTSALLVITALVLGYQLPVVIGTMALRRLAIAAEETTHKHERLRTAEAIAEQLHGDRQARYADLAATTAPLLNNLVTGGANLDDDRVRAAYLVEAARMRRLFAESDDVSEPLLHELWACADLAERGGVAVVVSSSGDYRTPPIPIRRALTEAVLPVLMAAERNARIVLLGMPDALTVSVVADGRSVVAAADVAAGWDGSVAVTRLVVGDRVWVEATWRPPR